MRTENRDWYDTPLYYDIIFDADTPREAAFLETMHERHGLGGKSRRLLEPACGSGRLVLEMARRSWNVSGFDGSAEMLAFARKRVAAERLRAVLWEDWMQSFTVPVKEKFDLAHCLVSTFKYLLTEADAVACLQRVADCLKTGGIFALGVHLTDYGMATWQHERWTACRDGIRVVANTRTWPADRKRRLEDIRTRLTIHADSSGKTRLQETRWQFRTYDAAQMRTLLRKVPQLELTACYDFTYDADSPRQLDDSYSDVLMILKRV